MSNPNVQFRYQWTINPGIDVLHILDAEGDIIAWIDSTGTGQGNLAGVGSVTDQVFQVSTSQSISFGGTTNLFYQATAGAGGITLTLPTSVGLVGRSIKIKKVDSSAGVVTINTSLSQTIDGTLFGTSYILTNYQQYVTLESDNNNWNVVANN